MRCKYAFKVLVTLQGMNEDDILKETFINIPVNMQLAAAARSTFKEALLMLAYVTLNVSESKNVAKAFERLQQSMNFVNMIEL